VTPAVTVLIPTHNRADVLPFAIRSVLAQTLKDFELFVVGDGCTDATAEVVAGFGDTRIRWFDFPKAPYFGYANRNRALREARGELVAYLGHDDLWLPDHLELLAARFRDPKVEFACSRLLLVYPDGTMRPLLMNLEDPALLTQLIRGLEVFGPDCVLHRRDCLERYGNWREDLPEGADSELWARILASSGRAPGYCDSPTALHFLADWRSQTRRSKLLYRLRRWDGSLTSELQVEIPAGMPEQEAVWRELAADPDAWTEKVRRGVRIEIERLARMEYPSALALSVYGQWRRFAIRKQTARGGRE
jgi:glycosyltransferase involved in cell wall biosynthesis